MDFDVCRNYVCVAESYTISEAARQLNIAQPALSLQIKNLEAYYGVQLIKTRQGSRHIELTKAGDLLYRRIKHLLNQEELLRKEVRKSAAEEADTIVIGTTPELAYIVNDYINSFKSTQPKGKWKVVFNDIKLITEYLERGIFNLIITPTIPPHKHLYTFEGAGTREIVVIGPKNHSLLQRRKSINLTALHGQQVAVMADLENSLLRNCREKEVDISFNLSSNSLMFILDTVMQTGELAIVSGCIPQWVKELVEYVPLTSDELTKSQQVFTYKGGQKTKLVKEFLTYLKEHDFINEAESSN
ncbi:LysR family transcriptional regulator [uncultured Veillonella sp.]|uniref:LysR family transcriptional regulator n=1 Tax=uncultured Veillonella sp. TaxID=159268 RepID=UPI002629F39B|nr:LysR family transcriptional regulator [uncultured Veillonella sp.]